MKNLLTASILTLTFLAGCDAHVDQEYSGEPLEKIQGQVTNPRGGETSALEVVLLWQGGEEEESSKIIGTTAPITGEFPANFELTLLTPPPESTMHHDAESGVDFTIAYIVAMPKGTMSGEEFGEELASQIQGAAPEHIIIYTSAPVAAETELATFVGGPLSAGYHLRRVDNVTEGEMDAVWACREAAVADCPDGQPLDAECEAAWDACGPSQGRILPASQDESISLILGSIDEIELPDFF